MDEIKKFLRLMDKEALIDLTASLLFSQLINVVSLAEDIARLEKVKKSLSS